MASIFKIRHQRLGVLPFSFSARPSAEHVAAAVRTPHVLIASAEEANALFKAGGPPWVMVVEEQLLAPGEVPMAPVETSAEGGVGGSAAAPLPNIIISGKGTVV